MYQDELKMQAAAKAVEYVKSGMKIGAWTPSPCKAVFTMLLFG